MNKRRDTTHLSRWGVLWIERGGIDGDVRCRVGGLGYLFETKKQARAFIKSRYGYIATRKDLRTYPHGWRMPKPVRVHVTLTVRLKGEK